jgi:hypothetical protein
VIEEVIQDQGDHGKIDLPLKSHHLLEAFAIQPFNKRLCINQMAVYLIIARPLYSLKSDNYRGKKM